MAQTVIVGDAPLVLDDVVAVAQLGASVQISSAPELEARVQRSRDQVAQWAEQGVLLYGVTTRYGGLATSRLSLNEARELQRATVWVHKTAAGRPIDRRDVRGAMLLRMNSLLHGVSGIRLELIRRLEVFLNRGITPLVYEFGSIGASGDLVPLSYIAGALTGSDAGFEVEEDDRVVPARDALSSAGLAPFMLEPKEGLALINGTSVSTAIAARVLWDARQLMLVTLGAHALLIEALGANMEAYAPFVHDLKPHPGQVWTAATMRRLLESSAFVWPTIDDIPSADKLIQDRYSIRCLPQFIGPIVEAMDSAQGQLETEMNAASDNPLIGEGARYHAGNFLAQVPALAMDHLRQHLGLLAKHLDVQVSLVMSPEFSRGLPASLVGNTSKHSNLGLKGLQLTGNSLMPLLTFYGNTFVDRFATHAEQHNQNINSLSYSAALLARESIRLYRLYVSIALVIAVQAVDLRAAVRTGSHDPRPLLAPATRRLYEAMRAVLACPADASRPLVRNDDEQQLDALVATVTRELEDGGRILGAVQPYAPSTRTR
jgi:phenylalanine ammonia-lyase